MAVSIKLGVLLVGVLEKRALLFGVYIRSPDVLKLLLRDLLLAIQPKLAGPLREF